VLMNMLKSNIVEFPFRLKTILEFLKSIFERKVSHINLNEIYNKELFFCFNCSGIQV